MPSARVATVALPPARVVYAIALAAALSGRPLRPWLAASIAGDVADVVATAAARGLPEGAGRATAAVAGGSALLSASVVTAIDC